MDKMEEIVLCVFINPGHDRLVDPGAVSPNGICEADIVWDVGVILEKLLVDAGVKVIDVFQDDDLAEVCAYANQSKANLFISIHCNAAGSRQASGTESFVWQANNEASKFAECVQKQICGSLKTIDRGVKTANFYVLKNTDMPACLIELAFLTNEWDEQQLRYRQEDFAAAIARAVTDYQLILRGENE